MTGERFEYRLVVLTGGDPMPKLNENGADGFRAVGIIQESGSVNPAVLMCRPAPEVDDYRKDWEVASE